jgi:hypothetical protein
MRGLIALDHSGGQENRNQREAAAKHLEHILERCAGRRGYNTDQLRAVGQPLLAGGIEQSFGFEFFLQAQELKVAGALAGGSNLFGIELVLAPGFIHADAAKDLQRFTFTG